VLVDGFVHGTWKIIRQHRDAILEVRPYRRLAKKDAAALESSGARLLRFAAPDGAHDLRFVEL